MNSTKVIKGFRAKKLLSQENVAKKLGITRQTYNSLENDLLNNDFVLVFNLLNVLDVNEHDIDEFFYALKQDYLSCGTVKKTNLELTQELDDYNEK